MSTFMNRLVLYGIGFIVYVPTWKN